MTTIAKVLKPTGEDATDTPSDTHTQEHAAEQHVAAGALGAGDKERQRNTPANNGDKPRLRRPVKARPTSSAGRPQTKRRAATAPAHSKRSGPRAQKASGYNFPRWLSQRSDFESLRQEQRNLQDRIGERRFDAAEVSERASPRLRCCCLTQATGSADDPHCSVAPPRSRSRPRRAPQRCPPCGRPSGMRPSTG